MCKVIEKEIQIATVRGELELVDILVEVNTDYKMDNDKAAIIRNQLLDVDIYDHSDSM